VLFRVIVEGRACGRVGFANARGVVLKAMCHGLPYGPQQTFWCAAVIPSL
jgi:hypothetical protein